MKEQRTLKVIRAADGSLILETSFGDHTIQHKLKEEEELEFLRGLGSVVNEQSDFFELRFVKRLSRPERN